MTSGNDGWVARLTVKERSAIASAIKNALPKSDHKRIKEAAEKLAGVVENIRSLSPQEPAFDARQLSVLAAAGGELEAGLEKACRARVRFQKLLSSLSTQISSSAATPPVIAEGVTKQLTDRMMGEIETAGELAALSGFSISRFLAQLDELEKTLLVARSLNRSFRSTGRGPRRKQVSKLLAIEIARTYAELSPRGAAGVAADPYDNGKLTGPRYRLAVAVFEVAFPLKRPPNGIIVDGFNEFRDAQLKP